MTATTSDDRQIRPFADFLTEINAGVTHAELSAALNELVTAVNTTGRAGSVTYTVEVKPAGRNSTGTVMIVDDVRVKLPSVDRPEMVFFVDANGNVTRDNLAQPRLPLRELGGGQTVDTETGEIGEAV